MTTETRPFQEIAALLRQHCGVAECEKCGAAASTLDRYAEVLATMPDEPSTTITWVRYQSFCTEFVARLRALSSPLTETTDT